MNCKYPFQSVAGRVANPLLTLLQQENKMGYLQRQKSRRSQYWSQVICLGLLVAVPQILPFLTPTLVYAQAIPAEVREGYTLLSRGLVNQAIDVFRRAVQRYPQSIEAKLGLAIAFRRAGRDSDAWNTYQQVLAQEPNNQLALKTVGLLGGYRQEWQNRGIEALTQLLRLNPSDVEARAQRALLYGYQGRFAESLEDYQVVLQNNPTPEALFGAAQVYTYSGNYQQGLALFERYRAAGKTITGPGTIAYARALRETGNAAQAVKVLEAQLPSQLNATAIQMRSELSQAYLANNQPTMALAVLDPLRGRSDSTLSLARALNELGKRTNQPTLSNEAANLYRQVLTKVTNPSPTLVREIADVLSGIPQERETALQLYRQLAQTQGDDPVLQIQVLALESELGLVSRAEVQQRLEAALRTPPANAFEQRAIAQALVRLEPDPSFLPLYQNLQRSGVDEPFLNFRIAQVLIQQGNFAEARRTLATYRATAAGSRDQATELLLADLDRREGNLEASARRFQAVINSNPADEDVLRGALRGLAGIRLTQGRKDEALAIYDRLVARDPQDAQTQLARASVALQANRISTTEAEAILSNWLRTRPTETPPELYSLVSTLPADPGRESLYLRLLEADPNNVPVQLRLVQVLVERDPAQARARVARLLRNNRNNPNTYFIQGQLAQTLGDFSEAGQAYEKILALEPENTDALLALGGVRFQQRRFDQATRLYNEALAVNPDNSTAQRALIDLEAAKGNRLSAIEQLEQMQLESGATTNSDLVRRKQQLEEEFLRQRGFQPPWERY
jgi:cellulose synthase operon protein C